MRLTEAERVSKNLEEAVKEGRTDLLLNFVRLAMELRDKVYVIGADFGIELAIVAVEKPTTPTKGST